MKKLITIILLLSSFGVMAQNLTFTGKSPQPIITFNSVKITGQDTSYTIYSGLPMREITYKYTETKKVMQVVKKDLYDGKNWNFYSVSVEPFVVFINTGYQLFNNPQYKLDY